MDLAEALKENDTLIKLNLKSNYIKDEGAKFLVEALKENNTLNELDIDFFYISDEYKEVLKDLPRVKSGQLTLRN